MHTTQQTHSLGSFVIAEKRMRDIPPASAAAVLGRNEYWMSEHAGGGGRSFKDLVRAAGICPLPLRDGCALL
eukprot:7183392-Pyramimonas_sp.AAC.1